MLAKRKVELKVAETKRDRSLIVKSHFKRSNLIRIFVSTVARKDTSGGIVLSLHNKVVQEKSKAMDKSYNNNKVILGIAKGRNMISRETNFSRASKKP